MRIKIYQIDLDKDMNGDYLSELSDRKVDPSIYKNVYYGDVETESLQDIHDYFFDTTVPTYQGRGFDVSDVIEVIDGEDKVQNGIYYCDKIGFKNIDFDTSKCEEMEGMDVVYVTPGNTPIHIRIRNELKDMQNAVGGLIEPIYNEDQTISVANEESKLLQMPPNRTADYDIVIHGPFFVCGDDGENFMSLNQNEIDKYMGVYSEPEEFPDDYEPDVGFQIYGF